MGAPTPLSRGDLPWHFAIPEDGALLNFGMMPYLIEWPAGMDAAASMADLGYSLDELVIHHPNDGWLKGQLTSIGLADAVRIESLPANATPHLVAHIDTPSGRKTLSSL